MKCVLPNLDIARLPLSLFFLQKKENGWPAVHCKAFGVRRKVCNWGPWAGSLQCMSRRITAWGYEKVFFGEGGFFPIWRNSYAHFLFFSFCPVSFLNATRLHLLIEWMPYQLWGVCSTFITETSFNSCLNERSLCFHNRECNYSLYFITLLPSEVCSYIVDVYV